MKPAFMRAGLYGALGAAGYLAFATGLDLARPAGARIEKDARSPAEAAGSEVMRPVPADEHSARALPSRSLAHLDTDEIEARIEALLASHRMDLPGVPEGALRDQILRGLAVGAACGQPATRQKLLDLYGAMGAKDPLRAVRHATGLAFG